LECAYQFIKLAFLKVFTIILDVGELARQLAIGSILSRCIVTKIFSFNFKNIPMSPLVRSVAIVCAIASAAISTTRAQEKSKKDPIAKQLKESKDRYAEAQSKATDVLLKTLDKQTERVKKNQKLRLEDVNEQLRSIEADKRALKERGALPDGSAGMKPVEEGVKAYRRAMTTARNQLLKDYKNAVGEYRKKADLTRATAVLEESQVFSLQSAVNFAQPVREGVLLASSEADAPSKWLYTTEQPVDDWASTEYDASRWSVGVGAFGNEKSPRSRIRTPWSTGSIWLRTSFVLPRLSQSAALILTVTNDDDVDIFVNGKLLHHRGSAGHGEVVLDANQNNLFHTGKNTLAVHCINTVPPDQTIDVGLRISRGK
jgi:hypothetical protein